MELIELNAKVRSTVGNGPARALRRNGKIPAILYGPGANPIMLSIEVQDLENIIRKYNIGQALFNLTIQNGDTITKTAMIKELQSHPMGNTYLHADFYEIAMDRKITVSIPVTTTGKSKGVELGGLLQTIRRELEVSCLPHQIPETIEIDVTDLEIGDSVHVEEIPLPEGVEILADVNFTVITILSPKVEEEEEAEAEEGEEGEEGEVEGGEEAPAAAESE